ncbi:MAG: translesion error-prone DNA polymerase V autoproteolytic subunit [Candidatus Pacebacteria bacterium]|nr:translesion error-prone DNA polymerase V autoproteolytic subunit [Candidatus Paceibacterota bacterium]
MTKIIKIFSVKESLSEDLPLYLSRPAAGFSIPGDDSIDSYLNINDLLVDNPSATFFVKVAGDSMEGAKIFSGDILVVDRSVTPVSGSIVVAAVFGEMVVKRLSTGTKGSFLLSEKEGYEPIVLTDNDDCFIWGTVIGSARVF